MSLTVFNASRPRGIIQQLIPPSQDNPRACETFNNMLVATWKGKRYVNDDLMSKKGSRGRTSWIVNEGIFIREITPLDQYGDAFWVCRRCDHMGHSKPFKASATTSAKEHLQRAHRIYRSLSGGSTTSSDTDDQPPPKRTRISTVFPKNQVHKLHELALGYIINSNEAFNTFDDPFIRSLMMDLNMQLFSGLSLNRTNQRQMLDTIFNDNKKIIRDELQNALTKVHLGFDLWTSPNRLAINGIVAHFTDPNGIHQHRLLALRQQYGAHTGNNIASTLHKVIQDWDIEDRVGTIICDNATNNDTCIQHLFQLLNPMMMPSDASDRRMRCFGHILNLVGRAFLYGEDSETFEQESQHYEALKDIDKDLRHWRRRGPIGKLRNIVKFIRSSPQRSERFQHSAHELNTEDFVLFEESDKELEVIMNNDTRWNSTYLMLDRAIKKQAHIQAFIHGSQLEPDPSNRIPNEDVLIIEDWRLLTEVKAILEPLYEQTMQCQSRAKAGGFGQLWEVLTGIEYLLDDLEFWKAFFDSPTDEQIEQTSSQMPLVTKRASTRSQRQLSQQNTPRSQSLPMASWQSLPQHIRAEYQSDERQDQFRRLQGLQADSKAYLRLSITNAWKKLNNYYTKLGDSPLFAASVILHPQYNFRWLKKRWNDPDQAIWFDNAIEGLERYWEQWYRQHDNLFVIDQPLTPRFLSLCFYYERSPPGSTSG
ncbi:Putative AC transposase-like protein [Cladobotryum mycophilum]|uniref:AC transposase-like protein n=1 Tax=Cladobotryum mycophilum TaxID=491253 RepID=A0ABR0SVQ6_9HYPO